MIYEELLPYDYCEIRSCFGIWVRLNEYLNDDYTLVARCWQNKTPPPKTKYVTIVTSCEQHNYMPPEKDDPNCLGVFMHYYPTTEPYLPRLEYNKKVFPLYLGTKNGFKPDGKIPMQERKYDVGFIGQFDPYRRQQFRQFALACKERYESFIQFYDGWNKGVNTSEYSYLMSQFRIALVPCGSASLNTFRYYEAMSSGCVIMCEQQYNHPSLKRVLGGEIITDWTNHEQLFRTIEYYISNESFAEEDRIWNLRKYNSNYSPEACAEYIMNHIKETNV